MGPHRNLITIGHVPAGEREAGFTLVEVLVSAMIVVLLSAAVAQGLIAGADFTQNQRLRSQADELAQQDQERLKGLSAKQLNGLSQATPVSLDNTQFVVHSSASFLNSSGSSSCGSAGTGAVAYFSTKSTVTWANPAGVTQTLAEEDSIITPPAAGTLLTQAVDQTGSPLSGVGVSASGPDVESGTTNANGCTIFAGLTPGSYNLTFTDPGYVDKNGDPSPLSDTANVTSSGTAAPSKGNPLTIGRAGTVTANFTATGSGGTVAAQADGLSWLGTGATYGMSSPAGLTSPTLAATLTASNLFPFAFAGPSYTSNYQVWGGRCTQMQPPTGIDTVSVGPGSSQSVPIREPALAVLVTYGSSGRVVPADVKLSFASTSGSPSCSDSWYAPISPLAASSANGALASPGQPFASGATTGASASASGQTGQYVVCADYNGHKATALTYNSSFSGRTVVNINIPATSASTGTC